MYFKLLFLFLFFPQPFPYRGRGEGRCQLNREVINFQKLDYQNYINSQIILADVKFTNSEKQVRDGGRRREERCIVLIDTDQT